MARLSGARTRRFLPGWLTLTLLLSSCSGYWNERRVDLAQVAHLQAGFSLGLYAEAEATSVLRPAAGFADASLFPRYALGWDSRPRRSPGSFRTAAFPTLLVGWPIYGALESGEGYAETAPYRRGFLAPFLFTGTDHVDQSMGGLFYPEFLNPNPRLVEARADDARVYESPLSRHGRFGLSLTLGLVRVDAGVNPLELVDFLLGWFGLDLPGDRSPSPTEDSQSNTP